MSLLSRCIQVPLRTGRRGLAHFGGGSPLALLKHRSELGAGTRGASLGIGALEVAALNAGSDFFARHPSSEVGTDSGALHSGGPPCGRRMDAVLQQCGRLAAAVEEAARAGRPSLVLSGDHSSGLATIAGLRRAAPGERLGVVWLDAHADLHSPFTSPSGNVHGMALAAALGWDHRDLARREPEEATLRGWEGLKGLAGTPGPMLRPHDLLYLGVRDCEVEETTQMRRAGIRNVRVEEGRERGLGTCLTEALAFLSHCDSVYLSFDVDAMDCDLVSRGTGTPVRKGFTAEEAGEILSAVMATGKVATLEVVEINPTLDERNRMAETAFRLLTQALPQDP